MTTERPTGEQVRKARVKLGLKQHQAARIVDVTPRQWRNYELGARNIPLIRWRIFLIQTMLDGVT